MRKTTGATIVTDPGSGRTFATSTRHTGLSQRGTLEAIMLNLANHLGIKKITRKPSARGADFYCPDGDYSYQSATNTIYELSMRLESVEH
jgi:hypothetical protein